MNTVGNRITYKRKRPNPMFQEWLEELHEEAKEKGSKLEPMLREALDSLSKYPLPLNSGAECAILRGFQKKLCIFLDKRLSKKNDPTMVQFKKFPDLKHEYRSLKVGDFLWIARHRVNNEELVLPYIIERKRMDDLGASIKDGRFHEQKFRLKKCGLKHVLYLIENYGKNKHVGLPLQALRQALANTKVQDGFKIHMTDSLTHSTRFLAMMTKRLTLEFKDQSLVGCNHEQSPTKLMTYEYFSKTSMKTKKMSVMETFVKMLVQLKGMSLEKALAVTNKFKTLRCIIEAYKQCGQREGQLLLANLKYGDLNRNVGPTVSKSVYDLFTERSSE
ncbi:crossover junction endonuclease MUS81 isoform X4 [Bombyx mandarina]|uniref:Crossover junction endonuclease MUS81 n=1 Tax=Bombyx mandarina TaxID=7092 RepID=A0A6J2KF05_BOMMA|nr:crossover junction endonuclease MUS81 isoform X4 [Bombyx mandarina]